MIGIKSCFMNKICGYFLLCSVLSQNFFAEEKITIIADAIKNEDSQNVEIISLDENKKIIYADNVARLLEQNNGVQILNYGGSSSLKKVLLRGNNPNQSGIYLNGILLNDALTADIGLENIPLMFFDEVEIYKSHAPFGLSDSHIGGAINFKIDPGKDKQEWQTMLRMNSLNNYSANGIFTLDHQMHMLQVTADFNSFLYNKNQGTLYASSSEELRRKNNHFWGGNYLYSQVFSGSRYENSLLFQTSAHRQGLAGVIGQENQKTSQDKISTTLNHTLKSVLSEKIVLQNDTTLDYKFQTLRDPDFELAMGLNFLKREQWSFRHNFIPQYYFSSHPAKISAQIEGNHQLIREDDRQIALRSYLLLFGSYQWSLDSLRSLLMLKGGYRLQWDQSQQTVFLRFLPQQQVYYSLPSAWAQWTSTLKENKETGFKANLQFMIAYNNRIASLQELYGDGASILPASHLAPENSVNYQISSINQFFIGKMPVQWQSAVFYNQSQDLIQYVANSQKSMIALNVGKAEIGGSENSLKLQLQDLWQMTLRYDYLVALDRGNISYYRNKFLPYRPLHTLSVSNLITVGSYLFQQQLLWQGASFRDRYNSYENYIESKLRFSLALGYKFKGHVITLQIENLLDDRTLDVLGYPLPGRNFSVQYNVSF